MKKRISGIDLLKVAAIVLVVISHVVQTLQSTNSYVSYNDYIVDLSMATSNIQYLVLSMLQYSGNYANTIFFVCSCWFLLDSDKFSKRKMFQMILDIWVISVILLVVTYIIRGGIIDIKYIVQGILPTTCSSNWYMTCYLIFYMLHPILNNVIRQMEQKVLLRCTLVLVYLYVFCNFIFGSVFFSSDLILWIAIYFSIAYMKLNLKDFSNNLKLNFKILLLCLVVNSGIIIFTNVLGLRFSWFPNNLLLKWNKKSNPLIIMTAICLLNISRNIVIESKAINYISKLSMLIYIIHENQCLRLYFRPMMWEFIYTNLGYDYILGWTFVLVLLVFVFGLATSIVYKNTIQKIVIPVSDFLYFKVVGWYEVVEKILLKIH